MRLFLYFMSRTPPPPSLTVSSNKIKPRLISSAASDEPPDFISLLARCSNLNHIYQTHGFMIPRGLDQHNIFLAQFIAASSSLGFSHYAYSVFARKTQPFHIYLYNTMIKSLASSPTHAKAAISLYNNIRRVGLRPDTYTFPFALKAVLQLSAIQTGRQLHSQTILIGLDSDPHVVTALIQMYCSTGPCISDARKLFDELRLLLNGPLPALWNAMLAGYAKASEMDNARQLFDCMPAKNVISWTAMIAGYAQNKRPGEAISIFHNMLLQDVEPDKVTLLVALSACAHLGALELGSWIHNYIDKHGLSTTVPLNNTLIDMYAKSGEINKALQVFENVKHKTTVTWTVMITGLALHGLGRQVLYMFSRMERANVIPNEITFIAILSACSHVGLIELGRFHFNRMRSQYGIEPNIEHYGCMIDLLGRAGYLKEAKELLRRMPFEANAAIWGSLLAASNIHGDAKLGAIALSHLVKLEPNNSGNYSLLSNTYASLSRWNESRVVRKAMRDTGVKKMRGRSFIEVDNRIHEFFAGGMSHPQFGGIFHILCEIDKQLKIVEHLQKECDGLLEVFEG